MEQIEYAIPRRGTNGFHVQTFYYLFNGLSLSFHMYNVANYSEIEHGLIYIYL